jgi:hypothetical protein
MFMDVFNDIVIDRRDNLGNIQKQIKVPCIYGSRSRILKSLENRSNTLKLPLIAVTITGLTRDESRTHSVNIFKELNVDGHFDIRNMVANPININYEVSIITKYQSDNDQIMSNFIPFFNPDIYVTWPNPHRNENIKSQVIWEGSINTTYPEDISEGDPWRITSDAGFVFKSWMFPGMGDGGKTQYPFGAPLIYHINLCRAIPDGDLLSGYVDGKFVLSGQIDVGSLNAFYDVPTSMEFDDYLDNIEAGYIKAPNFDCMPISGDVSGLWQYTSGLFAGDLLNPNDPDDLQVLIANYDNVELVTKAGYQSAGMKDVDFLTIWSEALSGRLSGCII